MSSPAWALFRRPESGRRTCGIAARDGTPCIGPLIVREPYGGRIRISAQVRDFDIEALLGPQLAPFADPSPPMRSSPPTSRGPGRARPVRASGLALRRSARHRRGRHAHLRRRHLQRLFRQQRPDMLTVPKLIPERRPDAALHALWRDRTLFRHRQRLFLGRQASASPRR